VLKWVLADSPMLEVLCRLVGGLPAPQGPAALDAPLLVFAHAHFRESESRLDGGLRELERMLAASRPDMPCHVAIVGFVPFWAYSHLAYLIGPDNYWQLPSAFLPCTARDYSDFPGGARSIAIAHNADPDIRRARHDFNDCLRISDGSASDGRTLILNKLARLRSELVTRGVGQMVDGIIRALAEGTPDLKAILKNGISELQAQRNQ